MKFLSGGDVSLLKEVKGMPIYLRLLGFIQSVDILS